jgi:hypothetical protein
LGDGIEGDIPAKFFEEAKETPATDTGAVFWTLSEWSFGQVKTRAITVFGLCVHKPMANAVAT